MTNSTENQTSTTKAYDVHTTGFGYLNNIRIVTPQHGGEPYYSCNIALQEGVAKGGDFSNIKTIYFQANVVGAKAKELIAQNFTFDDKGMSSPDGAVTAAVRLGGIYPETFTFKKGDRAGQTGVALKTRLLKINWLSIGKNVIPVDEDSDDEPSKEENVTAESESRSEETEAPAVETQPVSVATATNDDNEVETDRQVRLDKDDPNFEAKQTKLFKLGYVLVRFDEKNQDWVKPLEEAAAITIAA